MVDRPKKEEKECNIRKKRVTWKLDENRNMKKKKRKERAQKMLVEVRPDSVSELGKWISLINESLNDLYVDELRGDIDVLSLWFNARARGRKERAGTHLAEEGSRVGKDGGRTLLKVPRESKSVDRGI